MTEAYKEATKLNIMKIRLQKAYEKGLLNDFEQSFFKVVIEEKEKKNLRELTSDQFRLLRIISEKYEVAAS